MIGFYFFQKMIASAPQLDFEDNSWSRLHFSTRATYSICLRIFFSPNTNSSWRPKSNFGNKIILLFGQNYTHLIRRKEIGQFDIEVSIFV